ncbi:DUF4157 domain-containing protein [Herbidospora galbida]|uniref:DUF4157 domain-containing protein n=1 Tax=Herbidospora galbida TaxID=2575442 RepID=A0A4U3MLN9_9ACTN|nr:DUF4157 domain-containing protein [Herbidospora galbida]TKK89552.1 DUF4157 domain-containing protein [Herbidospora galbida]
MGTPVETLGERLAGRARELRGRRTVVPAWLPALAPMLDRARSLPMPDDSPRRRVEARVAAVDRPRPAPEWPAGMPLRGDLRERLVPVVGPAIDRVRVHTGERAGQVAAAHHAEAVTIGTEIFLGPQAGPDDVALLAHEVWHATEPARGGGAGHRSTERGVAEEELLALAVEHRFLDGPPSVRGRSPGAAPPPVPSSPSGVPVPFRSAGPPLPPGPPGQPVSSGPAPIAAVGPAGQPMAARPGRHPETPTAALDPGALHAMVREVVRGELLDQATRRLRADLSIELERGA